MGVDINGGWGNLGDWTSASNYTDAAQSLADRHARAAGLTSSTRLLDLGSGFGSQLLYWREAFEVASIHTVEPNPHARQAAQERCMHLEPSVTWLQESAETLVLVPSSYDAVICLDSAYHFPKRESLITDWYKALDTGGTLVFTDLALPDDREHSSLRRAAPLFDIPSENLTTTLLTMRILEAAGFTNIAVDDLTQPVMAGFASSWKQAWQANRARPDGAWLRYRVTAAACRQACRSGALRYVIFRADKS